MHGFPAILVPVELMGTCVELSRYQVLGLWGLKLRLGAKMWLPVSDLPLEWGSKRGSL